MTSGASDRSSLLNLLGKCGAVVTLVASLGVFGCYAKALLLKYPPVWPDEPFYTNPAINRIYHGVFGFTLLDGFFPGAVHHSFLVPLGYVVYSWVVFSLCGIGIVQARLGSLAAAGVVLFLTYGVARRTGLGRWTSLLPVSLLALDTVFLRGALVARADMLELALLLLSFWLAAPFLNSETCKMPIRLFFAGLVSGLAILMLHVSTGVSAVFLVGLALTLPNKRRTLLLPVLCGMAVSLFPGACYIGLHWREFILQFGAQVSGKSGRHPLALDHLVSFLLMDMDQYGGRSALVLVAWIGGLIGLILFARRSKFTRLLVVVQLAVFAAMLWGVEIWYPLYSAPLTMIGLVQLATLTAEGGSWWNDRTLRKIAGWVAVFLALWMAQHSLVKTRSLDYDANVVYPHDTDYFVWARQVSMAVPKGSTVLISVIPDPYFVLREREDLSLREFIPHFHLDRPREEMLYMTGADYVLVRGPYPDKKVWAFVQAHARLVKQIGNQFGGGYYVGVYKVIKK